ncbi:hypothetical protein OIV83_002617 [Microbotryomycetes sp. JL201]|nr:hypothetical protein OIV83_002617 [Microbotryomycetes sp. JL201]
MSDTWSEALRQLLPAPWTRYPASTHDETACLLVKTLLLKGTSLQLAVLATDLNTAYIEVLDQRALTHRVRTSLQESQDSQSQSQYGPVGYNADGELVVRAITSDMMAEVASGTAAVSFSQKGFYNTLHVTLSTGLALHFELDSMEDKAAACLATQLVVPLLGLSSALLGLLKDLIADKDELCKQIEDAVDASGSVERNTGGRACKTFFKVGGASILRRWSERKQRGPGRELDHIQLSNGSLAGPTAYPLPSSSRDPKKRSTSPEARTTRRRTPEQSESPSKSRARQMLNHKAPMTGGDVIGWDESQRPEPNQHRPTQTQRSTGLDMEIDHESDTDDENLVAMPLATQRSSEFREPPEASTSQQDFSRPTASNQTRREPFLSRSQRHKSPISPPAENASDNSESEDEDIVWQRQQQEKERKKAAALAEEHEARLQTLKRAQAGLQKRSTAMASGKSAAKKQKRL